MVIPGITTGPAAVAYSPVATADCDVSATHAQLPCNPPADFDDNSAIGAGIRALLRDNPGDVGDVGDADLPKVLLAAERQLCGLTHMLTVLIDKFPGMIRDPGSGNYRTFRMDVPPDDFRLNRASMERLLREIVPWWPDSAPNLHQAILQLAQDTPFNSDAGGYRESDAATIAAQLLASDATPGEWPDGMLQTVLRIGDWQRINLHYADLQDQDFSGIDLRGANLSFCNLERSSLCDSDLRGCDLSGANLRHANLKHCRLSYSALTDCDLYSANMRGVDARCVTFDGADMRSVSATQADFTGSGFTAVQLQEADFENARLDYTIGLACSTGTSFRDASLSHAKVEVQVSPPEQPQTFWNLLCRRGSILRELAAFRCGQFQALCSIDKERFVGCQTAGLRDLVTLMEMDGHDDAPIAIEAWIRTTGSSTSSRIRDYVARRLLPPLLERWNCSRVIEDAPLRREVLRYVTENSIDINWAPYGLAVNQLLGMRVAGALQGCDASLAQLLPLADTPPIAV